MNRTLGIVHLLVLIRSPEMCSPPRCPLYCDPTSFITLFKADLNPVIVEEVVGLLFEVVLRVVQGIEAPAANLHLRGNDSDSEHRLFLPSNKFSAFHPVHLFTFR